MTIETRFQLALILIVELLTILGLLWYTSKNE